MVSEIHLRSLQDKVDASVPVPVVKVDQRGEFHGFHKENIIFQQSDHPSECEVPMSSLNFFFNRL